MTDAKEVGKGGNAAPAPEAQKPRNRWFGVKNAIAVTVGAGAVAALVFARSCGSGGGPDVLPQPAPVVSAPAVVCPSPQPNVCNLSLGEHDPHSPNWAPEKCGFCGDNIQQSYETAETCPVDFHCGDGTCQLGVNIYGAYVAPSAQGGLYSLGTIQVTESNDPTSPNFCEADCGRAAAAAPAAPAGSDRGNRRRRDTATPGGPGPVAVAPPASSGCESEITSRFANRVSSALLGNADAARRAVGANGQTVRARVSISISNGVPTVTGINLSCPGCSGGSLSPGTVSLGGIPIDRSTSCTTSVTVNIPPG